LESGGQRELSCSHEREGRGKLYAIKKKGVGNPGRTATKHPETVTAARGTCTQGIEEKHEHRDNTTITNQ